MSYSLHQKISSGGMADLFLATQSRSDGFHRAVVIKCMREEHLERADFVQMFRTEVRIYASLEHPHIVNVMDAIEVFGRQAVVMELVVGTDLAAMIKRCESSGNRIPVKVILYICRAIAKGLHHAHTSKHPVSGESLGIIHRDVSPGNILVSETGDVKIADFGIAKARIQNHETVTGVVKGKFSYMSPEQAYGQVLKPTSDLFSLGVILWEVLAGQKRFHGVPEIEILQSLGPDHPIQKLRELQPEITEELNEIVMRAVAPYADDRYISCGAFAKVIDDYMKKYYPKFNQDQFRAYFSSLMKPEIDVIKESRKLAMSGEYPGILVEEQPPASGFNFGDADVPTRSIDESEVSYAGHVHQALQGRGDENMGDELSFDQNVVGGDRRQVVSRSRTMALNLSDDSFSSRKPVAATPIAEHARPISSVKTPSQPSSGQQGRFTKKRRRPQQKTDQFLIYSSILILILVACLIMIYRAKYN